MFLSLRKIDLGLVIPVLILATGSLVVIFSLNNQLFYQQLSWCVVGFIVAIFLAIADLRPFFEYRSVVVAIYILALILLIVTLAVAPTIRGTRSWIQFGPAQFQTSEFAKIGLILMLSFYFAKRHIGIGRISTIFVSALYAAMPIILVLLQPDMGTALVLGGIFVGFLFLSGIKSRHIMMGLIVVSLAFAWAWGNFFKDYQKERIIGLFYPSRDPLGVNYSVIQSKIAIGSGGFWGKGFGQGTQIQLGFLPEPQTDFIFSGLTEEWGFFGGIIILGAFLALLIRIALVGYLVRDNFSKFICLGTVIMFLIHFMLNVGSAMGMLPVIGVPFPFLSYGGSNLLVSSILLGIILSISRRSYF